MGVRIGAPSFLIKIRRTSLVSSYSRYGLRYERLQVIRKIPARDQAAEACLREPASQLPLREHRQPHAHHAGGSCRRLLGRNDRNGFILTCGGGHAAGHLGEVISATSLRILWSI